MKDDIESPPAQEYKVFVSQSPSNLNLMRIRTKITALSPPLQLYRQKPTVLQQQLPVPPQSHKHRARILDESDEVDVISQEELYPWILEDSDQHSFVGTYNPDLTTDAVLAFNKNEFQLIPISRMYRFTQRSNMTFLPEYKSEPERAEETSKNGQSNHQEGKINLLKKIGSLTSIPTKVAPSKLTGDGHKDEIDYDEIIDDDEEDTGDVDEHQKEESRKSRSLSMQGKMTKKLLERLESSESEAESFSNEELDDISLDGIRSRSGTSSNLPRDGSQFLNIKRQKLAEDQDEFEIYTKELFNLLSRRPHTVKELFFEFKDKIRSVQSKEVFKKALDQVADKTHGTTEMIYSLKPTFSLP